jgi:hypothetical protein
MDRFTTEQNDYEDDVEDVEDEEEEDEEEEEEVSPEYISDTRKPITELLGDACRAWKVLSVAEKASYSQRAREEGRRLTGWNLFVKEFATYNKHSYKCIIFKH